MASEREMHENEITSSNQIAAILFVSAAFISAGVFVSSHIKSCNVSQALAAPVAHNGKRIIDQEMHRKYRSMLNKASPHTNAAMSPQMRKISNR